MTRKLYYFPIIHTQTDMGAFAEMIRQVIVEKMGAERFQSNVAAIDQLWHHLQQEIDKLDLDFNSVRIYQDGLPVCGHETEIVTDLANGGSLNHRLLLEMIQKGARLTGTESGELLLKEYQLIQQTLLAKDKVNSTRLQEKYHLLSQNILKQRDQYIANRIDETLQPGEIGVIFIGMLHSIERWLNDDIEVIYPIGRPLPQKESGAPAQQG